jgi:hypothetical protein
MKQILLLLSLLIFTGCALPMSSLSFQKEVRKQSAGSGALKSKWTNEILYKGTEGEYHYFSIRPGLGFNRSVKVKKDELDINHEYPYTDDESTWLPYSDIK